MPPRPPRFNPFARPYTSEIPRLKPGAAGVRQAAREGFEFGVNSPAGAYDSRYGRSLVTTRTPQPLKEGMSPAQTAARIAGRVVADAATFSSQGLYYAINHPAAIAQEAIQRGFRGVGASKTQAALTALGVGTTLAIGSRWYGANPLDYFRPQGYQASAPDPDNPRQTSNPGIELFERFRGRRGQLLPYQDFIKENNLNPNDFTYAKYRDLQRFQRNQVAADSPIGYDTLNKELGLGLTRDQFYGKAPLPRDKAADILYRLGVPDTIARREFLQEPSDNEWYKLQQQGLKPQDYITLNLSSIQEKAGLNLGAERDPNFVSGIVRYSNNPYYGPGGALNTFGVDTTVGSVIAAGGVGATAYTAIRNRNQRRYQELGAKVRPLANGQIDDSALTARERTEYQRLSRAFADPQTRLDQARIAELETIDRIVGQTRLDDYPLGQTRSPDRLAQLDPVQLRNEARSRGIRVTPDTTNEFLIDKIMEDNVRRGFSPMADSPQTPRSPGGAPPRQKPMSAPPPSQSQPVPPTRSASSSPPPRTAAPQSANAYEQAYQAAKKTNLRTPAEIVDNVLKYAPGLPSDDATREAIANQFIDRMRREATPPPGSDIGFRSPEMTYNPVSGRQSLRQRMRGGKSGMGMQMAQPSPDYGGAAVSESQRIQQIRTRIEAAKLTQSLTQGVDQFMQSGDRSRWVNVPGGANGEPAAQLYIRKGQRWLGETRTPTIDIANIQIDPRLQGNNVFNRLSESLQQSYPDRGIYIESIGNKPWGEALIRKGWTPDIEAGGEMNVYQPPARQAAQMRIPPAQRSPLLEARALGGRQSLRQRMAGGLSRMGGNQMVDGFEVGGQFFPPDQSAQAQAAAAETGRDIKVLGSKTPVKSPPSLRPPVRNPAGFSKEQKEAIARQLLSAPPDQPVTFTTESGSYEIQAGATKQYAEALVGKSRAAAIQMELSGAAPNLPKISAKQVPMGQMGEIRTMIGDPANPDTLFERTTQAEVFGDYAVHRRAIGQGKTGTTWTVTHIPSGMSIDSGYNKPEMARAAAIAYRDNVQLPPLEFGKPVDPESIPEATRAKITQIREMGAQGLPQLASQWQQQGNAPAQIAARSDAERIQQYLKPKQADISQLSPERRSAFEAHSRLSLKGVWDAADIADAQQVIAQLKTNGDITQAASLQDKLNRTAPQIAARSSASTPAIGSLDYNIETAAQKIDLLQSARRAEVPMLESGYPSPQRSTPRLPPAPNAPAYTQQPARLRALPGGQRSLRELFAEADRIGSKYQSPGDPISLEARRMANEIVDPIMAPLQDRITGRSKPADLSKYRRNAPVQPAATPQRMGDLARQIATLENVPGGISPTRAKAIESLTAQYQTETGRPYTTDYPPLETGQPAPAPSRPRIPPAPQPQPYPYQPTIRPPAQPRQQFRDLPPQPGSADYYRGGMDRLDADRRFREWHQQIRDMRASARENLRVPGTIGAKPAPITSFAYPINPPSARRSGAPLDLNMPRPMSGVEIALAEAYAKNPNANYRAASLPGNGVTVYQPAQRTRALPPAAQDMRLMGEIRRVQRQAAQLPAPRTPLKNPPAIVQRSLPAPVQRNLPAVVGQSARPLPFSFSSGDTAVASAIETPRALPQPNQPRNLTPSGSPRNLPATTTRNLPATVPPPAPTGGTPRSPMKSPFDFWSSYPVGNANRPGTPIPPTPRPPSRIPGMIGAGAGLIPAAQEFARAQDQGASVGRSLLRGATSLATEAVRFGAEPIAEGIKSVGDIPGLVQDWARLATGQPTQARERLRAQLDRRDAAAQWWGDLPRQITDRVLGVERPDSTVTDRANERYSRAVATRRLQIDPATGQVRSVDRAQSLSPEWQSRLRQEAIANQRRAASARQQRQADVARAQAPQIAREQSIRRSQERADQYRSMGLTPGSGDVLAHGLFGKIGGAALFRNMEAQRAAGGADSGDRDARMQGALERYYRNQQRGGGGVMFGSVRQDGSAPQLGGGGSGFGIVTTEYRPEPSSSANRGGGGFDTRSIPPQLRPEGEAFRDMSPRERGTITREFGGLIREGMRSDDRRYGVDQRLVGQRETNDTRRAIARTQSGDRRYAADRGYEGRVRVAEIGAGSRGYAADRAAESRAYAADRGYEGRMGAAQIGAGARAYAADRGFEGRAYGADQALRGRVYAADQALMGRTYAADRAASARIGAADITGQYKAIASTIKGDYDLERERHRNLYGQSAQRLSALSRAFAIRY